MKITKLQFVTGILIAINVTFMFGVLFSLDNVSNIARALILPFLVYLHFTVSESQSRYFALFLISCAIGEFLKIITIPVYSLSRVSNIIYIFGYINLLLYISQSISISMLWSKFKVTLLILAVFNSYLVFVLNQMILEDSTIAVFTFDFLIECIYNICILLVLSFSLVNYLYHDSKKGLILFLASVCIVFSEMIQVAYLFLSSEYVLSVIYSVLLIVGFYLIYVYIVSKKNTHYKVLF